MKKLDKYINYIETVLMNKNIDSESTEWKQNSDFRSLVNTSEELLIIDSLTLEIAATELLLLVKINSNTITENFILDIKNKIEAKIQELMVRNQDDFQKEIFKTINLLFFVPTIQARLILKDSFSPKKSMELLKKIRKITDVSASKLNSVFYLDKDISTDEIKLPNIKRYEMVTLPPFDIDIDVPQGDKKSALKGYVFTANLFDVVSLYNTIGDQLFKKNVRLGIDDKLDVDKSIKETLEFKPEAFWFRNNGITILVEESQMKLDRVNEIILKKSQDMNLNFSVINGAQTITAASEYYYSLKDKDLASQSSLAKVIVKIIHIRDQDPKSAEKEAKTISVSLNRQKPIKAEDIAFTNEFVELMNDYLESIKATYTLVRRGEEFSKNIKAYSLINFAKARKACSGDPGSARSNATTKLLKIADGTSEFYDQKIFIPDWYSASDDLKDEIFKKYYSPILFAMNLSELCQPISKKTKLSGAKGNVIKNGMWYFIAYVIYLLNDGNDDDYSTFQYSTDGVRADDLRVLLEEFADFYCMKLEAVEADTNSNAFKSSDNYWILKSKPYTSSPFYQHICKFFGKRISVIYEKPSGNNSTSKEKTSNSSSSSKKEVQVVFDEISHLVSNKTAAFVYSVQRCLEKASIDKYQEAMETLPFLTRNASLDTGFFKQKAPVTVKGETIYIGKPGGGIEKATQLKRLCEVLNLEPQTILWKKEDSLIFKY